MEINEEKENLLAIRIIPDSFEKRGSFVLFGVSICLHIVPDVLTSLVLVFVSIFVIFY